MWEQQEDAPALLVVLCQRLSRDRVTAVARGVRVLAIVENENGGMRQALALALSVVDGHRVWPCWSAARH